MSSKRKAASGSTAVAAEQVDAHLAKRRKVEVRDCDMCLHLVLESVAVFLQGGGRPVEARHLQLWSLDWNGPMKCSGLEALLAIALYHLLTPLCTASPTPSLHIIFIRRLTWITPKSASEETSESTTETGLAFVEQLKAARDKR